MKLKKALSMSLALVLSLALTVPAFAAGTTETVNQGSVTATINNVLRKETHKYQIRHSGVVMNGVVTEGYNVVEELTLFVVSDEGAEVILAAAPGYHYYAGDYNDENLARISCQGLEWNTENNHILPLDGGVTVLEESGTWSIRPYNEERLEGTVFYTEDESDGFVVLPESLFAKLVPVDEMPAAPAESAAVTTVEVRTGTGQRLNVRTGPGTSYKIAAPSLVNGTVLQIVETQGQWGKLADDAGWVYLPGTKTISAPAAPAVPAEPASPINVVVSTGTGQRLNVRTGPGTSYKIAAPSLNNGTVLQIVETQGQWGKLADDAGWVYLPGTKAVEG